MLLVLVRHFIYTMFHFWWEEKLLKHQEASEYYDHNCLQIFLLSLLTALIVKSSHILTEIFLKSVMDQVWKSFNTEPEPPWKDQKSSYQARQFLALFYNLNPLVLGWNCVKGLRITKVVKEIKSKGTWGWFRP